MRGNAFSLQLSELSPVYVDDELQAKNLILIRKYENRRAGKLDILILVKLESH